MFRLLSRLQSSNAVADLSQQISIVHNILLLFYFTQTMYILLLQRTVNGVV